MEQEKIIEQLKLVRAKKKKAVETQSFEMASQLRDRETALLQRLERVKKTDKQKRRK